MALQQTMSRNYGSINCGARLISLTTTTNASNRPTDILLYFWLKRLSPDNLLRNDSYYLLAPRTTISATIELCEAVQVKQLQLVTTEVYSELPKVSLGALFVGDGRRWSPLKASLTHVHHWRRKETTLHISSDSFVKYLRMQLSCDERQNLCSVSQLIVRGQNMLDAFYYGSINDTMMLTRGDSLQCIDERHAALVPRANNINNVYQQLHSRLTHLEGMLQQQRQPRPEASYAFSPLILAVCMFAALLAFFWKRHLSQ